MHFHVRLGYVERRATRGPTGTTGIGEPRGSGPGPCVVAGRERLSWRGPQGRETTHGDAHLSLTAIGDGFSVETQQGSDAATAGGSRSGDR